MNQGKKVILATKAYAREKRSTSWLLTLSTLLFLLAAFFGALYPFHIAIRIGCSLLAALLLVRMFVIYHDYLHRAILEKSAIADVIFSIFGLYILAPKSIWKRSHDHHHKHNSKLFTSSIGSFPVVTKADYLGMSKFEKLNYLFIRHPLTIAAGYFFAFMWGMCMLSLLRSPSKHWDSGIALLFHFGIGITILLALGWTSFFLGFLIPSLIASGMGSYLFYAQHNFPKVTFADRKEWTYFNAALQSSSYMLMNPVMRWFTANIGYHHIHHCNARIPFYRLPEVHRSIPEFQAAKTTSLSPIDIVRCFQLKVWDPEANKMLKLSEIGRG